MFELRYTYAKKIPQRNVDSLSFRMDNFIKHIQHTFFVDFKDQEVISITNTIHSYLNNLKDLINQYWEGYQIEYIKRCGSMEETTRVWDIKKEIRNCTEVDDATDSYPEPVLEYDYLAIIRPIGQTYTASFSHPGNMEVHLSTNERSRWLCFKREVCRPLSVEIVDEEFRKTILSIIKTCPCFDANFSLNSYGFLRRKNEANCSHCSVCSYDRLHLQEFSPVDFIFRWNIEHGRLVSYINSESIFTRTFSKTILIKLDFLPVFELKGKMRSSVVSLKDSSDHKCFLIPKLCRRWHEYCWRISYCVNEIRLLKNMSQRHRDVYKIIKCLMQIIDCVYVPSYDIKNVVLSHIQNCKEGEGHIIQCLCQILSEYGNYVDNGIIPHFEINGLKLQRRHESREALKTFGQFIVLLSKILGQTSEKPCCGYHQLKLPKKDTILWTQVLRPELFTTSLNIVLGDVNCHRFQEELSKAGTDLSNYYDANKEKCDV